MVKKPKKLDVLAIGNFVLTNEAQGVFRLAEKLDRQFREVVELIYANRKDLFFIGVGKSGIIAQKIVATLVSTGTRAFFLHPTEALHGDFGLVSEGDLCVLISHSGETEEILNLIPQLKSLKNKIVAITGNEKSALAQKADLVLPTHVTLEACPLPFCRFNLTPSTSTTVTLALGDAIAYSLLELREFSDKQFTKYHRGGAIGRKLLGKKKNV